VKTPKSVTDAAKIDKGAKEFEAVLVGSWLQQAEQSFATVCRAPMRTVRTLAGIR
jgi:hypothetical protein